MYVIVFTSGGKIVEFEVNHTIEVVPPFRTIHLKNVRVALGGDSYTEISLYLGESDTVFVYGEDLTEAVRGQIQEGTLRAEDLVDPTVLAVAERVLQEMFPELDLETDSGEDLAELINPEIAAAAKFVIEAKAQ